jgi:hypothetical protein
VSALCFVSLKRCVSSARRRHTKLLQAGCPLDLAINRARQLLCRRLDETVQGVSPFRERPNALKQPAARGASGWRRTSILLLSRSLVARRHPHPRCSSTTSSSSPASSTSSTSTSTSSPGSSTSTSTLDTPRHYPPPPAVLYVPLLLRAFSAFEPLMPRADAQTRQTRHAGRPSNDPAY